MSDLPRRARLWLLTPAENAIREAVRAVEDAGCDVRLTRAVMALRDAQEWVADFVNGVPVEEHYPRPVSAPRRYVEPPAAEIIPSFSTVDEPSPSPAPTEERCPDHGCDLEAKTSLYPGPDPACGEVHTSAECNTLPPHNICWEDASGMIRYEKKEE